MKAFLSYGGSSLIISALLDPMIQSGLGKPVPWGRDVLMGVAGVVCLYLLVRFRNEL